MVEEIHIIEKTISEHHDIKESVKHAGQSLTDIDALFMLRQAYSAWSQSSKEEMVMRRSQMLQAVTTLENGLSRHFSYEEQYLPPLCGEPMMKAIIHEHRAIKKQMEHTKSFIAGFKLEGMGQPQLFATKNEIQDTINRLLQMVEEHSGHEETVLKMIRESLVNPEE
jgi:hemerythrin